MVDLSLLSPIWQELNIASVASAALSGGSVVDGVDSGLRGLRLRLQDDAVRHAAQLLLAQPRHHHRRLQLEERGSHQLSQCTINFDLLII